MRGAAFTGDVFVALAGGVMVAGLALAGISLAAGLSELDAAAHSRTLRLSCLMSFAPKVGTVSACPPVGAVYPLPPAGAVSAVPLAGAVSAFLPAGAFRLGLLFHGLGGIVSNFISSITPAPPDHRLYVQPAFEEAAFFPIRTSTPGSCRQVNDGKCSNAVICSHEMSQGHVSVLKQGEMGGASVVEGAMECFCSMYFGT